MSLKSIDDILVIDATHGGTILALEFAARGFETTCADVYKTLSSVEIHDLRSNGVNVVTELDLDVERYGLVLAPVHFPCNNPFIEEAQRLGVKVLTHHQAVKELLSEDAIDFKIVEVTGSMGKSSTIGYLKSILKEAGIPTSVLDSSGIYVISGYREYMLEKEVSTSPPYILKAVRLCEEVGFQPELAVFEVSLGGTGLADVGIITNVYDNYPIAQGNKSAFEAKSLMVKEAKPSSLVVLNADDPMLQTLNGPAKINWFSRRNPKAQVAASNLKMGLGFAEFHVRISGLKTLNDKEVDDEIDLSLSKRVFGTQHVENALAAVTSALSLGLEKDVIRRGVSLFEGLPGNMRVENKYGKEVVWNRSKALNSIALQYSFDDVFLIEKTGKRILILGGEVKTTCSRVDIKSIISTLEKYIENFDVLYFVGEIGESLRERFPRISTCPNLDQAYKTATESMDPEDILLICYRG